MQNVIINMCEKFHHDRLKNDRALGNGNLTTTTRTTTRTTLVVVGDPFLDLRSLTYIDRKFQNCGDSSVNHDSIN